MNDYNASTLIKAIQAGFALNQEEAGRLVLEPVAKQTSVNVDVDGKMVTNLVKFKKDVHQTIKSAAVTPKVVPAAKAYIQEKVIGKYNDFVMASVCGNILKLMKQSSVPDAFCKDLENLLQGKDYLQFLTSAILCALSRTNGLSEATVGETDFRFVEEAIYKCPKCGDLLWKKIKGTVVNRYRIVQIYPEELDVELALEFTKIKKPPRNYNDDENRIALCRDCAEAYLMELNEDEYQLLLSRKATIARTYRGKLAAAISEIESEIANIVKAISGIDKTTELQPFTAVLTLDNKIKPENHLLHVSIEDDVIRYYPYIETQFSLMDGVDGNSFNVIRSEITVCYEKLEQAGMTQEEICNELSNWILSKIGFGEKYKTAGNIIVSFFVQNCSVFKNLNVQVKAPIQIQVDTQE